MAKIQLVGRDIDRGVYCIKKTGRTYVYVPLEDKEHDFIEQHHLKRHEDEVSQPMA